MDKVGVGIQTFMPASISVGVRVHYISSELFPPPPPFFFHLNPHNLDGPNSAYYWLLILIRML